MPCALASSIRSLVTLLLLTASSYSLPTGSSTVDLGYAKYEGKRNDTLGLRYAAPPTGDLRWRAPLAIEDSDVYATKPLLNATVPLFECYQVVPTWQKLISQEIISGQIKTNISAVQSLTLGASPVNPPQSEDCLRLDVVVPHRPVSSRLPVAVYIHGGGYTEGNSASSDGSNLVSFSDGQLVYVAIQYRLGALGFLSGKDVKADGTANAGLLDQRLALEWVQKHIEAFGGDPNHVTIWGESAGGGSVTNQLILYGGSQKAPFHAAIPEYPWWQPFHDDKLLELQYQSLQKATNCTSLSCLRRLDSAVIAKAQDLATDIAYSSGSFGYGEFLWGPSVDGTIIRDLPSSEFAGGHFTAVPVLTDRDAFEGAIFTNFSISTMQEVQEDLSRLWPHVGASGTARNASFFKRLFELYPSSDFTGSFFDQPIFSIYFNLFPTIANNSAYWQRQTIYGDYVINCPTFEISKALVKAGQTVYKMLWAAGLEFHSSDSPYIYGASRDTDNPKLADTLKDYLVGFITKWDPNANHKVAKPNWPRYAVSQCQTKSNQILRIEDEKIYTQRDPDASEKCTFFVSNAELLRN